ncbi:hypothetical protein CDAR_100511 [Caerostris darwini]|uniref:Uncharacterized protein n=1 Tax=Caerostris darwini TaxID=1538125 RepID=A0AAV4X1Y2_9ARAC|nr:hypothetical protein CDAR_100511 [Caerostris darwini]
MRSDNPREWPTKAKIGSLSTLSGSLTLRHKTCADASGVIYCRQKYASDKGTLSTADGHQTALGPGMGRRNLRFLEWWCPLLPKQPFFGDLFLGKAGVLLIFAAADGRPPPRKGRQAARAAFSGPMNPICFVGLPQCLPPLLRTICVFTCCTRAHCSCRWSPCLLQLAFSRFCCWLGRGERDARGCGVISNCSVFCLAVDVPSAPVTLSLSCSRWWKMMQIENGGEGGPRIDLSSRYWGSVKERGFVVWSRYPVFDDSAEEEG